MKAARLSLRGEGLRTDGSQEKKKEVLRLRLYITGSYKNWTALLDREAPNGRRARR